MNQNQHNQNIVSFRFTPDSLHDLEMLSQQLGAPAPDVIAKALALLKLAQGRLITFKDKSQEFQVTNYVDKPAQVNVSVQKGT